MSVANELDPELPARFVYLALTAPDARWRAGAGYNGGWGVAEFAAAQASVIVIAAAVGNRIYDEINVPDNPTFPYIMLDGYDDPTRARHAKLPRDFKGSKTAVYTIRRFDQFASGRGSYAPGKALYPHFEKCLCGVRATPIWLPNNGAKMGRVIQSVWQADHKQTYRDDNTGARITEYGLKVAITYENSS